MFSTNIFILLACSLAIALATPVDDGEMPGATVQLTGEQIKEVEKELEVSLNHLAAGHGPHFKISKVISASVQIVSGALVKMNVDLVDTDGTVSNCNVSMWSRPWLVHGRPYGTQTSIECPGRKTLVESH